MAIVPCPPDCTMERVPSSPYVICLGNAERAELESLSRRASAPFRLVLRSRIVLLAAAGTANRVIAERLGICQDTARKWRRRYCEQGIEGLSDAPRPGRPRVFPPASWPGSRPSRDFEDPDELATQILPFEKHYNAAARPFDRKFTRTDLNRLLTRIRQHDRHAPRPQAAQTPTNQRSRPLVMAPSVAVLSVPSGGMMTCPGIVSHTPRRWCIAPPARACG